MHIKNQTMTKPFISMNKSIQYTAVPAGSTATVNCSVSINTIDYIHEINRSPVDIAIVFDTSGSMELACNDLKSTLKCFAKQLLAKDRLCLVKFGESADTLMNLRELNEKNLTFALNVIENIRANGGTPFHDAVLKGILELRQNQIQGRDQYLLIFTDGKPNKGKIEGDLTLEVLSKNMTFFAYPPKIHTVGYTEHCDKDLLTNISKLGHGKFTFVSNSEDIDSAIMDSLGFIRVNAVTHGKLFINVFDTSLAHVDDVNMSANRYEKTEDGIVANLGDFTFGATKRVNFDVKLNHCEPGKTVVVTARFIGINALNHSDEICYDTLFIERNFDYQGTEEGMSLLYDRLVSKIKSTIKDTVSAEQKYSEFSLEFKTTSLTKFYELLNDVKMYKECSEELDKNVQLLEKAIQILEKNGKLNDDDVLSQSSGFTYMATTYSGRRPIKANHYNAYTNLQSK